MGYLSIVNLYRPEAQIIFLFKECWALEKIEGTSAHLTFKYSNSPIDGWKLTYFSGGESHERFIKLFDEANLLAVVKDLGIPIDREIICYGECYGAGCQGMSHTYGKDLKFIVFDVQIGNTWLSVPDADDVAKKLGLEFVHYRKVPTDLAALDAERDYPSVQAIRNGISTCVNLFGPVENPKPREGIVIRPLQEFITSNGSRVICKHKGDAFKETATPRPVVDPEKLKVLEDATAIANDWTTMIRLNHVLDKLPKPYDMTLIPKLITAMVEDIYREGKGEFVESDAVKKAIGKKTVELFKGLLNSQIQK